MDRPILFSGPMIRAILREIEAPGTGKTQTRRTLKGPWDTDDAEPPHIARYAEGACAVWCDPMDDAVRAFGGAASAAVGDRLWVRELWRAHRALDDVRPRDLNPTSTVWYGRRPWGDAGRLRPGIHMPRWGSRLTLHVTDVRVQRLQDISEEDARAEGIEWREECWGTWDTNGTMRCGGSGDPCEAFRCLWININGPEAWTTNPWVAAISFRPVLANIDAEVGGEP